MKKKALAYIGGPKQLKDFIWYYLAYGKDFEWDLVCQPMVKEMRLEEICQRSGLFHNIFVPESFFYQPRIKLVKTGLEMTIYWMFGQNKKYALKEVDKITNIKQYEHMCLSTTRGVICGLMALCGGDHMSIDLLEDGVDATNENVKFEIKRLFEADYLISYAFAKMGYFNANAIFPLKSTKKCNRYSEHPEKLSSSLYKNVFFLNDMSKVDREKYEKLLNQTFGVIDDMDDIEAILFTTSMRDFTSNYKLCNDLVMNYLKEKKYKIIAVKRHPRDIGIYNYTNINVREYDSMIPGEDFVDRMGKQEIYFMYPSTLLLSFTKNRQLGGKIHVFHFMELQKNAQYRNLFEKSLQEVVQNGRVDIVDI